jgi:hypothetical protein
MKFLKAILFIIGLIIAANASAQSRAENTSSARAYYGTTPGKTNFKVKKKKKMKNYTHTEPAKGTQTGQKTTTKKKYLHTWAA